MSEFSILAIMVVLGLIVIGAGGYLENRHGDGKYRDYEAWVTAAKAEDAEKGNTQVALMFNLDEIEDGTKQEAAAWDAVLLVSGNDAVVNYTVHDNDRNAKMSEGDRVVFDAMAPERGACRDFAIKVGSEVVSKATYCVPLPDIRVYNRTANQ